MFRQQPRLFNDSNSGSLDRSPHDPKPQSKMSTTNQPETTKATVSDSKDDTKPLQTQKPAAQLEEDDEFEDFPVEGRI